MARKVPIDDMNEKPKAKSVALQVNLICKVAIVEICVAVIILLSQTIAIAASNEFATRSLTGIWTSWFFFMAGGLVLFWSRRCTFNGLLAVLVLQIIAATMAIPLFTACCIIVTVYNFVWNWDDYGAAMVGSSITIMTTNLLMIFTSMAEMGLNAYNAYNCYFLAYGRQAKDNNYDERSMGSGGSEENDVPPQSPRTPRTPSSGGKGRRQETQSPDPGIPSPPPDLILPSTDILIIKYCGVTGLILTVFILCAQICMLALAQNDGIKIGVGIWGALYFAATGIVTVYNGWKPTSQSTVALFILHIIQLILSIPMMGISYYIVAVFGSCMQQTPLPDCDSARVGQALTVTIMAGIMALAGFVQGLISLILILISSQGVCGIRCMVSGSTVYPML